MSPAVSSALWMEGDGDDGVFIGEIWADDFLSAFDADFIAV